MNAEDDESITLITSSSGHTSASCRVCNGIQPPHWSFLHFRNVVFARSLPGMFAARHNVIYIACGCTAHRTYSDFSLGNPIMFRSRGGRLSRAHSVVRPPCTPRQCVVTRESFFGGGCRISLGCYMLHPSVLTTSRDELLRAHKWEAVMLKLKCCESVGGNSRVVGDRGCSVRKLSGARSFWHGRCAVFPVGQCRTACLASCCEMVCLIPTLKARWTE